MENNLLSEIYASWKPAPPLRLSTYADEYAYLSEESSHEAGRWTCLPYQVGIFDAFTDPKVEKLTWKKSARVGYTKFLNIIIQYCLHYDRKSVLVVQPTVEDGQGYSKEEIAPMLRDTPCLQGLVAESKTRDSGNTILKKTYPGGFLTIAGANSARGFRRISVPVILFDEVDGYPITAGIEGDQIKLGTRRADYFWDRKVVIGSTPLIKDTSKVERSFLDSDQRYYYIPCPICKKEQILKFGNRETDYGIKWPSGRPEEAYYLCEYCHEKIQHSKKRWMVERGEWVAKEKFKGHAGFFLWAAYSYAPNAAWGKLAQEWIESYPFPELKKTFVNTIQGLTFEEPGARIDWKEIAKRREPYHFFTVPAEKRILAVVAGIDTQDDRLVCVIIAYGYEWECWVVWHGELIGDPDKKYVWDQLDRVLGRKIIHGDTVLHVQSAAIDKGGHKGEAVKNYCRPRYPLVIAVEGARKRGKDVISRPTPRDVTWMGVKEEKSVMVWQVGADLTKAILQSRLKLLPDSEKLAIAPQINVFHFPMETSDEFFQQLTSEKLITSYDKNGQPFKEWKLIGPRRDYKDAVRYAFANMTRLTTGEGAIDMKWKPEEKAYVVEPQPEIRDPRDQEPQRGPRPKYKKPKYLQGR